MNEKANRNSKYQPYYLGSENQADENAERRRAELNRLARQIEEEHDTTLCYC